MRNPRRITIDLKCCPRLPLFGTGARIGLSAQAPISRNVRDESRRCGSALIRLNPRRIVGPRPRLRWERRGTMQSSPQAFLSVPVDGELRLYGRIVDDGRAPSSGDITCRLTAFVCEPAHVERAVTRLTFATLVDVRRQLLNRMADAAFRRDLQLYLLLRLRLRSGCTSFNDLHVDLRSAWTAFAAVERRRMLRRLRRAVRRLESSGLRPMAVGRNGTDRRQSRNPDAARR